MERLKLRAESREVGKKGPNRRLRKEGFIPAVLYGRGVSPQGLKVNAKEFTSLMRGGGTNALIDLDVAGGGGSPAVVMLKEYQTDILTHRISHVDLLRIDLEEKVTVKVTLHLTGKAVGVTKGGVIEQSRRELEVICLPGNIPDKLDVDITTLDLGDNLHVHDLKLPEGVELVRGADFTIVSIVSPKEEEAAPVEVAPAEAAAAAPAAEGTAAPAAGAEHKVEKK